MASNTATNNRKGRASKPFDLTKTAEAMEKVYMASATEHDGGSIVNLIAGKSGTVSTLEAARRILEETTIPIQAPSEMNTYSKALQGKGINGLISSSVSPRDMRVDEITHNGLINSDGVLITIDGNAIGIIDTQTYQVLLILLDKAAAQLQRGSSADDIDKNRTVFISLDEYMAERGLKDRKEARTQLNTAIKALYAISLEWDETGYYVPEGKSRKVKHEFHHQLRITDHAWTEADGNPVRNSIAGFRFSFDIAKYLSGAYLMPYPKVLLRINTHYHPYSFPIGYKLCVLHNTNYGDEKRQNKTTVKTLLEAAKEIPRYKDISATGQIYDRIMKPFNRDLSELVRIGMLSGYWYCDEEGVQIPPEQLGRLTYAEFSKLDVYYDFKDYPDQTPRIEAKQARIRAAINRRKNDAKKKTKQTEGQTTGDGGLS